MNAALLVTSAICVGAPAVLAAALLAWQRHPVIDAPDQPTVVDAEDDDGQPTDEEKAMLLQLETFLNNRGLQRELDAVDDLDLPIKLRQAIRRRVIAGERLADVYQVNRRADQG